MSKMPSISPFTLAALIMGIGIVGIPFGDTAGKMMLLRGDIDPLFIAWSRYGFGIILVWLAFAGRGFHFGLFRDWRMWMRSVFVTASIVLILNSIATEPLANAFAAFFVGPIFAYFGAALLLKEKITWFRTISLIVAFLGVLIVVRPGFGMSPGLGYALLGGLFYAAFLVSTRWLSDVASPRLLLITNMIMGTLMLTPWGIGHIPNMDFELSKLVLWSAAASAVGNMAIVLSSSLVDGSRIAPLIYMQLVYATLFGILFFGEYPDHWTWIGLAVLVTSGFASFFAQRR